MYIGSLDPYPPRLARVASFSGQPAPADAPVERAGRPNADVEGGRESRTLGMDMSEVFAGSPRSLVLSVRPLRAERGHICVVTLVLDRVSVHVSTGLRRALRGEFGGKWGEEKGSTP